MTEILTKEKQFLKLNEQLDRIAVAGNSLKCNANNTTSVMRKSIKDDGRYFTFHKTKGQSTLLKEYGAGDGISNLVDNKEQHINSIKTNKGTGSETYRTSRCSYEIPTSPKHTSNRVQHTKYGETNRPQTYNRVCSRNVPSNTSTFNIKYRNAKFVESPSLEVLVKDESSSIKCQKNSDHMVDDIISTGMHSQMSNNTLTSKKNLSSEGLIKFLKSKVVILEEDHDRISREMVKQRELLDKTLEHSKMVEQQRDQAVGKNNTLNDQLNKCEKQLEETNGRLKDRNLERIALQKEFETTKRELKILTQSNNNLEKRLFRANEELESVRNTLATMKTNEREQKEAQRVEVEAKEKQIKSLKKQRADLLNAYKKQLFLIDNLKRQNICLEQSKMISFAEKEFTKILEWDMKN